MKKVSKILLLVFVASILVLKINASCELSWYCKRTKDHSQPSLDSNLSIVDKYGVIWIDRAHATMDQEKVVYLKLGIYLNLIKLKTYLKVIK